MRKMGQAITSDPVEKDCKIVLASGAISVDLPLSGRSRYHQIPSLQFPLGVKTGEYDWQ
jgi:hypothetical protein